MYFVFVLFCFSITFGDGKSTFGTKKTTPSMNAKNSSQRTELEAYLQADPKLQDYYATLNPDDRSLFEDMVKEELGRSTPHDDGGHYHRSGNQNKNRNENAYDHTDASFRRVSPRSMDDYSNQATNGSTRTYKQQLDDAARQPAIPTERLSLHSQRLLKQQQMEARESYSFSNVMSPSSTGTVSTATSAYSILSIGTPTSRGSGASGSPFITARALDPTEISDRQKKLQAQQAYARQLQEDSRMSRSTPLGDRVSRLTTRAPSGRADGQSPSLELGSGNKLRDQAIRNITSKYHSAGMQPPPHMQPPQAGLSGQWDSRDSDVGPSYSIPGLHPNNNSNINSYEDSEGYSPHTQTHTGTYGSGLQGRGARRVRVAGGAEEEPHVLGASTCALHLLGGNARSAANGRGRSSGGGVSTFTLC